MTIRAVLFDLDDTLLWDDRSVEEAFSETCKYAQTVSGVNPDALQQEVREAARTLYASYDTFEFTKLIGINPFEALWAHFTGGEHEEFRRLEHVVPQYRVEAWTHGLRALGIEDEGLGRVCADLFMKERRQRPYVYAETFEVLAQLKAQYPLLLLTNGAPCLQQEKLDGVPGILEYFDHIVISGNFAEGKPAISLFEHAMSLLGIEPHEGLMIGDKLTTDIQGSINVGMHNAWVNRTNQELSGVVHPEFEINSLQQISEIIRIINNQQAAV
ncbi:HAD family hydrolase [Paenibacillus sp. ACRRX]|uniref:HAD family hydrolase n=1 Tax=unclassified Paenibacillus TaxID=185978 RepID=UPI001EF6478D|nr:MULTISPECIES: HAD family hydrolase [unclassified Paenibacillus]MCG7407176.1 HAD family hydrolase [Paenibacillus sp. ACRRX]MDK8180396.1 HAD family hydrolase [Paenibacillus sp. UMB4589-SE434]